MECAPDYSVELEDDGGIRRLMAEGGLELRDFFAGHALSGLLARGETIDLAGKAYSIADRMIDEANRTKAASLRR